MRWLALILMLLPQLAQAQNVATLVADTVTLTADDRLTATGNVVAFFEGTRMSAHQIIYDRAADRLIITGPIVVQDATGAVLTAQSGDLDPRLENGILLGARLVLDQELQLAANQINRQDGRYLQLYRSTASSCRVCGTRAPLWEIRAERVVHDTFEQQLYFENATFLVRGLPLFWLPVMRLPDPTLERATGFLIPRQRNTSRLGTGIKLPYFITLGDHADVTLTPYVSAQTRTLEMEFRRAFVTGSVSVRGAVSDDTLQDDLRSYLFANGNFRLPADFRLAFNIETVSDKAYLLDYDYDDKDRLESGLSIVRVTDNTLNELRFSYFQTLRDVETNASLPPIIGEARYEARMQPSFGGTLGYAASIDTAYRTDDTDGLAGRDVTRAGARADWRRDWILPGGVVATAQTGLRGDIYSVRDDSSFPGTDLRVVPSGMATLRWPLAQHSAGAARHLIEPTVTLSWAEAYGGTPPNEDSTRSEFDPANLFDRTRFAGQDAVETGTQLAAGLTWTRLGQAGNASSLTFGRVFRDRAQPDLTPSSGLDGTRSDWLVSGQYTTPAGFLIELRGLFDDAIETTRTDGRVRWRNDWIDVGATYIWQARDPAENRFDTISEWTLDAGFQLTEALEMSVDARYNVAADLPVQAGVGFQWQNECVTIAVSASRRYTSSSSVDPTTTFGLTGTLAGFSAGRSGGGPAAQCRQ
ncbi:MULTISPECIES: LPS-assembly protein LptD [unclassified Yoonia]|uniref:LPS-assembly protein LptD n=1 Tax=unclassified Yoonia TaxID=2629118 RepID=UPI002AFF5194|nr:MULTISPECIES: LPS assembly protein LptD [unclassified Yoonia]